MRSSTGSRRTCAASPTSGSTLPSNRRIYAIGFIGLFTVGGLTGLFLAEYYSPIEISGLYWHFVAVQIAFLDLGPLNVVAALTIAVLKATLVVLFFMHVKYSTRLTWAASLEAPSGSGF